MLHQSFTPSHTFKFSVYQNPAISYSKPELQHLYFNFFDTGSYDQINHIEKSLNARIDKQHQSSDPKNTLQIIMKFILADLSAVEWFSI